jgi:hypothetical protein
MGLVRSSQRTKSWAYRNAPASLVERHLKLAHGKKPSWIAENSDDLCNAHVWDHHLSEPAIPHTLNDELN